MRPDLSALVAASHVVGSVLGPGNVVVYESTVYPGATEEVCVPVLEEASRLAFNRDFFAGYSPERINPGDKTHRLSPLGQMDSQRGRHGNAQFGRLAPVALDIVITVQIQEYRGLQADGRLKTTDL